MGTKTHRSPTPTQRKGTSQPSKEAPFNVQPHGNQAMQDALAADSNDVEIDAEFDDVQMLMDEEGIGGDSLARPDSGPLDAANTQRRKL